MILIVEDDRPTRDFLLDFFEDERSDARAVGSVAEAFELLEKGLRPAIVLLDLWMPGASGLALLRALKEEENRRYGPVRVIILTAAHPIPPAPEADAILRKPFSLNALLNAINLE